MYVQDLEGVLRTLPEAMTFNYYDDRHSPWLLARLMPEQARVAQLRAGLAGKLLDRPALRTLVAGCGGILRRSDVIALAHADRTDCDAAGACALALQEIWSEPWQDYHVTFTEWGRGMDWRFSQVSREGGSLVIQLGFPSDHAQLMGRYLPADARAKFEESYHPVRTDGRPTLAWARVDVDVRRSEALIEEVQCDWLRFVADEIEWLADADPRSRRLRAHQAYQKALFDRYAKVWPQAMLLATLSVLHEKMGINRIWMHTAEAGAALKGLGHDGPPRSLYSRLPKRFCFAPVSDMPAMLVPGPWTKVPRAAKDRLARLPAIKAQGKPLFWRLDLLAPE